MIPVLLAAGALPATSLAGQFPWEAVAVPRSDSRIEVRFPGTPGNYYRLWRSLDPWERGEIVALLPWQPGVDEQVLADPVPRFDRGFYRVEQVPLGVPADSDADGRDDMAEWFELGRLAPLNAADPLEPEDGAIRLPDRSRFEQLARRDNVPGAMGIRETKILITGVDTPTPRLHFLNTNNHEYHYYFARDVLGHTESLSVFNTRTYFRNDGRRNIAGSLLAHDHYLLPDGRRGIYTLEFWPTDPVSVEFVELAYRMVTNNAPFVDTAVYYHPAGETQRHLLQSEAASYRQAAVQTITTEQLFGNVAFSALNPGRSFGRLRVLRGGEAVGPRDIVVLATIPNDLARVAGIISGTPQTPLSHINLKAKQNDTPNAYIRDAPNHPDLAPLVGQWIRYEVSPDGFEVRRATQAEVDAFFDGIRPPEPQFPPRDLSVTEVRPFDDIGLGDIDAFGAKACHLGELRNFLPGEMVPQGFAVPFAFYDAFMRHNGFYDEAMAMMAEPDFATDPDLRDERLAAFRRRIERGATPGWVLDAVSALQAAFPAGTRIRCRSSTNNEDLPGFNGAGLYESKTHKPNEGHLVNTLKQVWAGLWTTRAFEERDFHRIDHFHAAMGVACHPNHEDEQANGVAVTRNLFDPGWRGYYVNVQVGEDLVTNPSPDSTPDEFLISAIGPSYQYEVQYVRFSSLTPDGTTILSNQQAMDLANRLRQVQEHFRSAYAAWGDAEFAMEVEFKITAAGQLVIKQARPWVD